MERDEKSVDELGDYIATQVVRRLEQIQSVLTDEDIRLIREHVRPKPAARPFVDGVAVAKRIVDDLSDRRGLKHEWNAIDEDIKEEIITKWAAIIEDAPSATLVFKKD